MNLTIRWPEKSLPIQIDCAPPVLSALEMVATDGLLALPRIGLGTGGLLLGNRSPGGVVILRSLPIPCSHALGPAFVLTPEEIAATEPLAAPEDLSAEEVVGWYSSKTRGPMTLTDHDRLLFDTICPEPWQVVMLIRPAKGKPTTAAFGLRLAHAEGAFQMGEWADIASPQLADCQAVQSENVPEPVATVQLPPEIELIPAASNPQSTCRSPVGVPADMGYPKPEKWPDWTQSRWFRLMLIVILLAVLGAAAFFTRKHQLP